MRVKIFSYFANGDHRGRLPDIRKKMQRPRKIKYTKRSFMPLRGRRFSMRLVALSGSVAMDENRFAAAARSFVKAERKIELRRTGSLAKLR